jgi:hypothetical protein
MYKEYFSNNMPKALAENIIKIYVHYLCTIFFIHTQNTISIVLFIP